MARTRVRYVDAPRNDVYVGMLALSLFAIVVGCAVLALESDDYGWSTEAKAPPPPTLPSPSAAPKAAPAGATTTTPPVGNTPAPAPMNPMPMGSSRAPKPADPGAPQPTSVAATPPAAPAPAAATPPAVSDENATVKVRNDVPRPGFNPNLPRK